MFRCATRFESSREPGLKIVEVNSKLSPSRVETS